MLPYQSEINQILSIGCGKNVIQSACLRIS